MGEARIEHEGGWTAVRTDALKALWVQGLSASQIARELGEGVTRNAVISKVHRLKLSARGARGNHVTKAQRADALGQRQPVKPRGQKGQPKVNAIVASAAARARISPPAFEPEPFDAETDVGIDITKRVGLMDLTSHTCRWPVGADTGARQMFCGCRKGRDAGPYCPEHTSKAEYRR